MDQIIRLSKQEAMNLKWIGKARNLRKGVRDFFQTLNRIGNYLVCTDGFRIHATQVPEQLLSNDSRHFLQLTPVAKSILTMFYHVGLGDVECTSPKTLDQVFPRPDDQIVSLFISPKLLKDALDGISNAATSEHNPDTVIVRIFKDTHHPDNITPIIVESCDGKNLAVIMCMLGDKEKLKAKHFQLEPVQTTPQNKVAQ